MKELSIEEKAKAYDDAIEKAKKWYNPDEPDSYGCIIENIFPELKESEDEKIRQEIIDFIFDKTDTYELREKSNSWLAWLEKQGEQKHAWSEEDEEMLNNAIRSAKIDGQIPTVEWLKYLKYRVQPQSQWKPSDEQMENLSRAFNGGTYRTSLLMELYKDLKKLREE